jgi:hypothetical protein
MRVAEFLRKLPPDQLAALADGSARLEVVAKGGRRPATGRAAKPAPVGPDQVRAELAKIGDPAAGRRWLVDLGMTVAQLAALAKELDIAVRSKPRKDEVLDRIVQSTIGRRRDFEALSRPAPARF